MNHERFKYLIEDTRKDTHDLRRNGVVTECLVEIRRLQKKLAKAKEALEKVEKHEVYLKCKECGDTLRTVCNVDYGTRQALKELE